MSETLSMVTNGKRSVARGAAKLPTIDSTASNKDLPSLKPQLFKGRETLITTNLEKTLQGRILKKNKGFCFKMLPDC